MRIAASQSTSARESFSEGPIAAATVAKLVLALIILAYLGLAILYARSVPKWNAPDEPAHYNYIKNIAQTWTFPVLKQGDYNQNYLARETTAKFPDSMPIDGIRYEDHQPPLYYLLATPLYWATSSAPVNIQVLALRLLSIVFGVLTIATTYAIGRSAFPDDAVLPVAAAALVAFLPMHIFMTAAINNDALANLLLSALVLALVVSLRRTELAWAAEDPHPSPLPKGEGSREGSLPKGVRSRESFLSKGGGRKGWRFAFDREAALWGVILGLGLLTKVTDDIGVGLVAFVVLWQEIVAPRLDTFRDGDEAAPDPAPGGQGRPPLRVRIQNLGQGALALTPGAVTRIAWRLGLTYAIALAISGWWLVRDAMVYGNFDIFGLKRQDLVVVGQPLTGSLTYAAVQHFFVMSFKSFWGVFGWMGVMMDERIYVMLAILSGASILGLAIFFVRLLAGFLGSRGARYRVSTVGILALLVLEWVFLFIGVAQYNLVYIQAQGRYFFPAIASIAIFFVVGLRQLVSVSLLANRAICDLIWLARGRDPHPRPLPERERGLARSPNADGEGSELSYPAMVSGLATRDVRGYQVEALGFGILFIAMAFLDLLALHRFIIPQLR